MSKSNITEELTEIENRLKRRRVKYERKDELTIEFEENGIKYKIQAHAEHEIISVYEIHEKNFSCLGRKKTANGVSYIINIW